MNLLACLLMQFVVSGEFFPSYKSGVNVWAPAAVINALMLGFMGLYLDAAIFYAAGAVFGIEAILLRTLLFHWSCLVYGLTWAVFLFALFIYLRRLRPDNDTHE